MSGKKGYLIWGPYNKDPTMVLYSGPLFSETPHIRVILGY